MKGEESIENNMSCMAENDTSQKLKSNQRKRMKKTGQSSVKSKVETDSTEVAEDDLAGVRFLDDENQNTPLNAITSINNLHVLKKAPERTTPSDKQQQDIYKLTVEPPEFGEDFFVYRRRKKEERFFGDQAARLSDEILLHIFSYLPKPTIGTCASVCKRWRNIAYDDSLWRRLNFANRTMKNGGLGFVIMRGVQLLRLAKAKIMDSAIFDSTIPTDYICNIQYLDLSMATLSIKCLETLLRPCTNLKKVSLEHCEMSEEACRLLAQNDQLEVLNCCMCSGITEAGLLYIISGCLKLDAMNLAWTHLTVSMLDKVCTSFPPNIKRLNISGCRTTLTDEHVANLVVQCPDLVELDVSDATELTPVSVKSVIEGLENLEYLSMSRCYGIHPNAYILLNDSKNLLYFDVYGVMNEASLLTLKHNLPGVQINKFYYSSVARPTIGVRRTSIWGLRVRD